eukprot:UC1_evm1s969
MTPIVDVFMVHIGETLDFKTISRIIQSGYSRIPAYGKDRDDIVGFLYVKDLAFVDPDDRTPVETVVKYYNHKIEWVYDNTRLDQMLEIFKNSRTHIVIVMSIDNSGEKDPQRVVSGICTLEDVIEDIIQQEIVDETDTVIDNKTKSAVDRSHRPFIDPVDFASMQAGQHEVRVSEQMALAAATYLSTAVPGFTLEELSAQVLKKI